jgi:hypothetical protein
MNSTSTITQSRTSERKLSAWAQFWTNLEHDRLGYGTCIGLLIFCTGAITMAFGGGDFFWRLVATVLSSMALLVSFLVLAPLRVVANIGLLALVVNIIFIVTLFF